MEYPTRIQKDYNEHREKVKLSRRKQDIQRALIQKRKHDKNPIACYDLSGFRPRYGKKKQRCWYCGGKNHKSNSCHSIKISQLQRLCWELQDRIETLENALNHSIKAAESRKRKQMVKIKKKKRKKHEELVKENGQRSHDKNITSIR